MADTTSPEIILVGPSGTGKTRALLEKAHALCQQYPGARGMLVRKTRTSLTQSALIEFDAEVRTWGDGIRWHGQRSEYQYLNGSVLVVAGIDDPARIMSTQYDFAVIVEATELTLNDWEMLSTRTRNSVMAPWNPMIADCNPGPPRHWLKLRIDAGLTTEYTSTHEDNPRYYDHTEERFTPEGEAYLEKLDRLSGVRLLRLRKGLWAAAEGMVLDEWNPAVNLIDSSDLPVIDEETGEHGIPADWPRYWSIDFGYTRPFVFQAWAEDPDGRLYLYRELYRTRRLVEEHARDILRLTEGDPDPMAIIVDHDAEDRATLERHANCLTLPAYKAVIPGLQAIQSRLRVQGDGKARLFILRDALEDPDLELVDAALPYRTADEIESYVWDQSPATERSQRERPVKANDHGVDAMRYIVAFIDNLALELADELEPSVVVYDRRARFGPQN